MAEINATEVKIEEAQKLDFIGMEDQLGLYSDAFLVARTEDVYSLYFFQNQLPPVVTSRPMQSDTIHTKQSKCIARMVITKAGMEKIVSAMAAQLGLTISEEQERK